MRSESPQAAGALEGDPSKIIVESQTPRPAVPAASANPSLSSNDIFAWVKHQDLDDHQQWLADQVLECYGPAAVGQFWWCVGDGCFELFRPRSGRSSTLELADVRTHISWVHSDVLRAAR